MVLFEHGCRIKNENSMSTDFSALSATSFKCPAAGRSNAAAKCDWVSWVSWNNERKLKWVLAIGRWTSEGTMVVGSSYAFMRTALRYSRYGYISWVVLCQTILDGIRNAGLAFPRVILMRFKRKPIYLVIKVFIQCWVAGTKTNNVFYEDCTVFTPIMNALASVSYPFNCRVKWSFWPA